jgi:hypothetical protein
MDDLPGANGLKASGTHLYILAKKAVLVADASKNDKTIGILYVPGFNGKTITAYRLTRS